MTLKIAISVLQILWLPLWIRKHLEIRRGKAYGTARIRTSSNRRYQILSYALLFQNMACVWFINSNAAYLWKFDDSDVLRVCGMLVKVAATLLYFSALKHLGTQYSPCYDSYAPTAVITSGPYAWMRHPMYVAKIALGISEVLLSGSYWFIPGAAYVTYETLAAWNAENQLLYPS